MCMRAPSNLSPCLQGVNECMTVSELRTLIDELGGKLARKRVDGAYVSTSNSKRRKQLSTMSKKV